MSYCEGRDVGEWGSWGWGTDIMLQGEKDSHRFVRIDQNDTNTQRLDG